MNKRFKNNFQIIFTVGALFIAFMFTTVITILLLAVVFEYDLSEAIGRILQLPFNRPAFLLFLSAFIILMAVIAYWFSSIQLKPLRRFQKSMEDVAKGDFSIQLETPKNSPNEIAGLVHSFNIMTKELASTEMLKQNFINDFSHEFKTPIASINGFANILIKNNLTNEQKTEYLSVIANESARLVSLSKNILLLNKVESQDVLVDTEQYDVSEQVRLCVVSLQNLWDKKDIAFDIDIDEVSINANKELLNQVWLNLIENAVNFSDEKDIIIIKLHKKSDKGVFSITNFGKAIPSDTLDKIFDKFYQADSSRSIKGNGIGLSIVKRICELHEGKVSVRSSQENGTTFTVEI